MFLNRKSKIIKRSTLADILIHLTLLLLGAVTVVPLLHIFSTSISEPGKILGKTLLLWPRGFELESYRFIFKNGTLLRSFQVTLFITVVGTALNLLFTTMAAYALSKRDLPGRKGFTMFIVLTIILSAGIIPNYMLISNFKLIDSLWSLILPGLVSGFNLLLMRNYFMSLPESLIESAKIDGARELRIVFQIMIPLSVPALITIGMFYALGHWNEFFNGMIYINDSTKWPLQVTLRGIVTQADFSKIGGSGNNYFGKLVNVKTVQAAAICAATLPVMVIFPITQKYFAKGVVMGAVKE